MIIRINVAKRFSKHILFGFKCKFHKLTCKSNQKWINDNCQCECKKYCTCTGNYSWNHSICICEILKYLKSIDETLVSVYDEIIKATATVSTNVTNTVPKNMTITISINIARSL